MSERQVIALIVGGVLAFGVFYKYIGEPADRRAIEEMLTKRVAACRALGGEPVIEPWNNSASLWYLDKCVLK